MFEHMQIMYKEGNAQARPNLVSYVMFINPSNAHSTQSAQKAEDALFHMSYVR